MTEQEWLSSRDPVAMLEEARRRGASDRKLRLFADICRERFFGSDSNGGTESKWEYEARMRDDTMSPQRVAECWAAEMAVSEQPIRVSLLRCIFGNPFHPTCYVYCECGNIFESQLGNFRCPVCMGDGPFIKAEIPWHSWHDRTIPRLAQAIYDGRNFDRMPILADALEEAGCANEEILQHCRGFRKQITKHYECPICGYPCDLVPNYVQGNLTQSYACHNPNWDAEGHRPHSWVVPQEGKVLWLKTDALHARGCWVLDLLLEKT